MIRISQSEKGWEYERLFLGTFLGLNFSDSKKIFIRLILRFLKYYLNFGVLHAFNLLEPNVLQWLILLEFSKRFYILKFSQLATQLVCRHAKSLYLDYDQKKIVGKNIGIILVNKTKKQHVYYFRLVNSIERVHN